jgi:hypothetical protein
VLAGKLAAQRSDCAPLAGKSTLNRLELSRAEPTRYHKISHDPEAIESLFVELFLDAHKKAPKQIILDLDATAGSILAAARALSTSSRVDTVRACSAESRKRGLRPIVGSFPSVADQLKRLFV